MQLHGSQNVAIPCPLLKPSLSSKLCCKVVLHVHVCMRRSSTIDVLKFSYDSICPDPVPVRATDHERDHYRARWGPPLAACVSRRHASQVPGRYRKRTRLWTPSAQSQRSDGVFGDSVCTATDRISSLCASQEISTQISFLGCFAICKSMSVCSLHPVFERLSSDNACFHW